MAQFVPYDDDPLLDHPGPRLLRLAWPIAIAMLSYSVMTLIDTLFVGRLGAAALGGVGLGGVAAFTLVCFGFGLLRAVKVLTAQAVGAGEHARLPGFIGAGLVTALGLGVLVAGAGCFIAPELEHLAASHATGLVAAAYCQVRVLGSPIVLLSCAVREARYGRGDSQSPMRAAVLANVLHVPLNVLFIFTFDWGVTGAALATLLAQVLELGLLLRAQWSDGFGLGRVSRAGLEQLWRLGLPIACEFLLNVTAFAALVSIIARMSEVDLAAHQIALQVTHFSFLPALALGEAASVLSGQAVGARQPGRVPRIARAAIGLGWAHSGACAVVFIFAATVIAGWFTSDSAVVRSAAQLLYISAGFQLFDTVGTITRSVLRGTGDVRVPAAITVVLAWMVKPPLALWLGLSLGFGASGAWLALAIAIAFDAGLQWWRLQSGAWRRAVEATRRSPVSSQPHVAPAV